MQYTRQQVLWEIPSSFSFAVISAFETFHDKMVAVKSLSSWLKVAMSWFKVIHTIIIIHTIGTMTTTLRRENFTYTYFKDVQMSLIFHDYMFYSSQAFSISGDNKSSLCTICELCNCSLVLYGRFGYDKVIHSFAIFYFISITEFIIGTEFLIYHAYSF